MRLGTKSVLFGCHQFIWHPLTVILAWRKLYKSWPTWWRIIGILCHDTPGYWGAPNIDGVEGKRHPFCGAALAARIVAFFGGPVWDTYFFTLLHSRDVARQLGLPVSEAYAADKLSIFFDPPWLYLLRVRLSGEIAEFKRHATDAGHIPADATDREWLAFYRNNVLNRPEIKALL